MRLVSREVWEHLKVNARRGVLAEMSARSPAPHPGEDLAEVRGMPSTTRHSFRPTRGA